jgi:RNA polymerase-binding transcription factor DksA
MAPLFLQILVQRESTQHEILRQIDAGFTAQGDASGHSARDYSRLMRAEVELQALRIARRRIEDRSYGSCLDCGAAIDLQRLNTFPTTAQCQVCEIRRSRRSVAALRNADPGGMKSPDRRAIGGPRSLRP